MPVKFVDQHQVAGLGMPKSETRQRPFPGVVCVGISSTHSNRAPDPVNRLLVTMYWRQHSFEPRVVLIHL